MYMMRKRACSICQQLFVLTPTKPGKISECPACAVEHETLYVAKVAYPSKNACFQEIEITKDHAAARAFNRAQRRLGAGVTGSLVEVKS